MSNSCKHLRPAGFAAFCRVAFFVVMFACLSNASEFIPLGDLAGGDFFSTAKGVSDDGLVVVGNSKRPGTEAFRWTDGEGMVGLGQLTLDNASRSAATVTAGISGNGTVIVGYGASANGGTTEPFRWSAGDGMLGLGETLVGQRTHASAVSEFGDMVVGDGGLTQDSAWYWTQSEGLVELWQGKAEGVNSNGGVIAGFTLVGDNLAQAVRWTLAGKLQLLQSPEEIEESNSYAFAISNDGLAIVGMIEETAILGDSHPFIWTEDDGMKLLADNLGRALGVSNNGEIVVGGRGSNAFIWNENTGALDLKSVLSDEYGLVTSIQGWELGSASDISPNGRYIVGSGTNPDGNREGWLVRLDYPFLGSPIIGDFNDDKVVDVLDLDALGLAIQGNSADPLYDLDESGAVGPGDIRAIVETVLGTWIGDSNLDGEFNSRDLVMVFQSSQYEDSIDGNSSWETGDWNLDGDFTTTDLVFAFQDGGYEKGPRQVPVAVPEPGTLTTILIGLLALIRLPAHDRVSHCSL